MKIGSFKSALILLGSGYLISCAAGEQEVNKRQNKKVELTAFNDLLKKNEGDQSPDTDSGDANPDTSAGGSSKPDPIIVPVDTPVQEAKFPELKLAADAYLQTVNPSDLLMVNKISATTFVLYGKGGKSWSYEPELPPAERLKALPVSVLAPEGSTLYTLPNKEFWIVSSKVLSRKKPGQAEDETKAVKIIQHPTSKLPGDLTKMRVLYISQTEVILHLDSHIAIISAVAGTEDVTSIPLKLDELPVDLKGELSAGKSEKGYWFRSAAGLFFYEKGKIAAERSRWTKSPFVIEPADLLGLAIWPDEGGVKFAGQSLGLSAAGLVSDVVQPSAPMNLR